MDAFALRPVIVVCGVMAVMSSAAADARAQSSAGLGLTGGGATAHVVRPTGTAVTLRATYKAGRLPRGTRIIFRWARFDGAGRRTGPVNRAPCPPRARVCTWSQNSTRAGTWGYRAVLEDRHGNVLARSRAVYLHWRDTAPAPAPVPTPTPTPVPPTRPPAAGSATLRGVFQEGATSQYCDAPLPGAGGGTARAQITAPWGNTTYEWLLPGTITTGASATLSTQVTSTNNGRLAAGIGFKAPSELGLGPFPAYAYAVAEPNQTARAHQSLTFTPQRVFTAGELFYIRVEIMNCTTFIYEYVAS